MRLLYVFPEPFPLPRARALQVTHSLTALVQQGCSIQFVSRETPHKAPTTNPFSAIQAGQDFTWQQISPHWQRLSWAPASSKFFHTNFGHWLQQQEQHTKKFNAILVRHLKSVAITKAILPDLPLIYEAHEVFSLTASPHRQRKVRALEEQALRLADGIITNSHATANILKQEYTTLNWIKKPLLVLANGVQNIVTPPPKFTHTPSNDLPIEIVYAGSFFTWKGSADLWQALLSLTPKEVQNLPPLRVTLMGGEEENIANMSKRLDHQAILESGGLRGQLPNGLLVELLNRQPIPFVQATLQRAHIAILPNRPDIESRFTSPIKLFEYMAAGCAILASDLPAIREIVDTDSVEFFQAGQPESLKHGLLNLIHNPSRCAALGKQAHSKAADYTWNKRAEKQLAFIQSLIHV